MFRRLVVEETGMSEGVILANNEVGGNTQKLYTVGVDEKLLESKKHFRRKPEYLQEYARKLTKRGSNVTGDK